MGSVCSKGPGPKLEVPGEESQTLIPCSFSTLTAVKIDHESHTHLSH